MFKLKGRFRVGVIVGIALLLGGWGLWLNHNGYRLDCADWFTLHNESRLCALRFPDGGGRSLQQVGQSLAYWRWNATYTTNERVWLFTWATLQSDPPLILPDHFFEGGLLVEGE